MAALQYCEIRMIQKRSWPLRQLVVVLAGSWFAALVSGCASLRPDEGLIARATDAHLRVEARMTDAGPVLSLWTQGRTTPNIENHRLLPADLAQANSQWHLQHLALTKERLVLTLQSRFTANRTPIQEKRFEFDLKLREYPLVFYRESMVSGDSMRWTTADFVSHQTLSCAQAPVSRPEDCATRSGMLRGEVTPTLAGMGSAQDFVIPAESEGRR